MPEQPDSSAGSRKPRDPFAGPPIFAKPTADEIPPDNKQWWTWAGVIFALIALPLLMRGVVELVAGFSGGGISPSALIMVIVGLAFGFASFRMFTANNRAVAAWRREHEASGR